MASEIERLPDFAAFLKLASIPDWQRVTFIRRDEPLVARPRRPVVVTPAPSSPSPPADSTPTPRRKGKKSAGQKPDGGGESNFQPP
jgi:hypothetical protein